MSLRENIAKYFSLSEFKDLCYDLAVDFDELPPGGKSDAVRGLLMFMEKEGRLGDLLALVRESMPHVAWPDPNGPLSRTDLWGPPERTPLPFEPEFVFVPPGLFLMGSPANEGFPSHETPRHELSLPGYYISRLPITNGQFAAFVQQTKASPPAKVGWFGPRPPKGKETHPVAGVSWDDAQAYCAWLGDLAGQTVRLPTEAEWEKAARGSEGARYPWGNAWDPARCNPNADSLVAADAHPGGASPYGCLDMVGNAAEWTSTLWGVDWLNSDYPYPYDPLDGRENLAIETPCFRVFRGTTLGKEPDAERLRCSARSWYAPDNRDKRRGFRVVMEP